VDNTWLLAGLIGIITLLVGVVIADHQRRLSNVEEHAEDHDRWAAIKSEELAALKELARSIMQRLDRQDGILDRIRDDLKRMVTRNGGT